MPRLVEIVPVVLEEKYFKCCRCILNIITLRKKGIDFHFNKIDSSVTKSQNPILFVKKKPGNYFFRESISSQNV